jgi:predicted XRE-type DNA-binding protein
MSKIDQYENVWDALADTAGEAANMRAKTELMRQIADIIKKQTLTQTEAAKLCGVTQPRVNDILRGRISRFSLDALVNIAAALGQEVHIKLKAA